MNPPPPMLPAAGSTTASANATATAASTAFPPRFRISTPACEPSCSSVATIPCDARTASFGQSLESMGRGRNSAAACERAEVAQASESARKQASSFDHLMDADQIFIRLQTLRDSHGEVKNAVQLSTLRDVLFLSNRRLSGVCGERFWRGLRFGTRFRSLRLRRFAAVRSGLWRRGKAL